MVASPTAVRAVSHGAKLVAMGRMTPRSPVGSAMPMKVASPRVMPVGPFVSDWTRQVGLRKPTLMKGCSAGALPVALGEGFDYDNYRS